MAELTKTDLWKRLLDFPRVSLIHAPTPFKKLEFLTQALSGPEIFVKREDLTGLAFGGNKSRKLEYIMPDVLEKKADVIITWASVQSNWCLQTAAAAKKLGITPILILFKTYDLPEEHDGNLLLDFILDADIRIRQPQAGKFIGEKDVEAAVAEVINEIKAKGHEPYVAPVGGSVVGWSMDKPLGALGYFHAFLELHDQAEQMGVGIDYVIHASGSGSTQAGMAAAAKALGGNTKVLGISVLEEKGIYLEDVWAIARDTLEAMQINISIEREDIQILDEYIREGYGIVNQEVADAVRLMAFKEGIFIDPVYTGKALVALIDLIKKGYFQREDKVVFMHTGGTPALFPNKHLFGKYLV